MNSLGKNFRITTFGESHGPAIGVVIDGCPPGIHLGAQDIQPLLDRRRPGKSPLESPRREMDQVEILSGVFEGTTTGAPIAMIVYSRDARPEEYRALQHVFRPGHADYTYYQKYGIRDHRGGGRSSGRETVARVAAGALAMKCLKEVGITIQGKIMHIHGSTTAESMEQEMRHAQEIGDSVGGVIELIITGCPSGLGDPVFGKLDAGIAGALMSIGGVKGVEIGDGFQITYLRGSEANDGMDRNGFLSNHSGGILGGISSGNTIVVRCAIKPTPSIALSQKTITTSSEEIDIRLKGRHDPCIVPRVLPVAEAMLALVLYDAFLEQMIYRRYIPEAEGKTQ